MSARDPYRSPSRAIELPARTADNLGRLQEATGIKREVLVKESVDILDSLLSCWSPGREITVVLDRYGNLRIDGTTRALTSLQVAFRCDEMAWDKDLEGWT